MAKKNMSITATSSVTLQQALDIHKNRTSESIIHLLLAKTKLEAMSDQLNSFSKEIDEVMAKNNLADIEKVLGSNPAIIIDSAQKITFSEKSVLEVSINTAELLKLGIIGSTPGGLVPAKFTETKISFKQKEIVDALTDGSLPIVMKPYVSVHTETKTRISKRAIKNKNEEKEEEKEE